MRATTFLRSLLLLLAFAAALFAAGLQPARAALQAAPAWWGASAAAASTWHYRVPLTVPAGTVTNATAVFNVDFNALLAQLGAGGTFDATSPRVVATNGTVVPRQEFTDAVYAGVSDTLGNGRGEVRFLATSNATTYWLYFDITQNGTKGAGAGIAPIGGNFEHAGIAPGDNATAPSGWTLARQTGAIDSQVRPAETPSINTDGGTVGNGNAPRTVDGNPRSGQYSYLLGARSSNETTSGTSRVTLTRTITVPAANAGDLRIRYRVQGWDSNDNGQTQYDYLSVAIIDGGTTVNIVGPAVANSYTTLPFAPNKGTGQAGNTNSGYGQYNGFDTDTQGRHRSGMTVARGAEPWWEATRSLTPYAGRTITLRFTTSHTVSYRSWWHLDDIEWSVVNGTVGTPQGFGAVLELPAAVPTFYPGQPLPIRARLDAEGGSGIVIAKLYRPDSSHAGDVPLFNDGSHGDATAGDALWTNDGAADGYIPGPADPTGTWTVRLYAADGSTPLSGQPPGLLRVVGQASITPVDGVRFSNVDVKTFNLAALSVAGRVYRDANRNGAFDTGEPAAPGMYVKLLQGGVVLQVATPDANGAYVFNGLAPGSYAVLQSVNNATADTAPSVPAGYLQSEPAGGGARAITLTAGGGNVSGANFGQYPVEARLTGKVFADTGAGGATALDGVQATGEPPLAGVSVSLLDGLGNPVSTTVTRGDGAFELALPAGVAGSPLTLSIPLVSGHDLARLGAGTTAGTVSLPARTLVFTPAAGTDYTGVVASLLPVSTLAQGQGRTVPAGGTAGYAHRFNAAANGSVSFALASQPPASLPAWGALLYRDLDCNGVIDGADAILGAAVTVQAGGSVCLVVRDSVPQSASVNMANQHQLSAMLTVSEGAGYVGAALVNLDVTTVGAETGAGLTLTKAVRNLTTASGWDTNGQALPGQMLQYRLTFRNDTASAIGNVQVSDFLPAYAVFNGAACGAMPAGLACAVTQSPAVGATAGALRWTFTGTLAPGTSGDVTFDWTLMN